MYRSACCADGSSLPLTAQKLRYLFSAKGAAFISSLGQRPRDSCNAKPSALKARFIPAAIFGGVAREPLR
jgi:hypothetical protein